MINPLFVEVYIFSYFLLIHWRFHSEGFSLSLFLNSSQLSICSSSEGKLYAFQMFSCSLFFVFVLAVPQLYCDISRHRFIVICSAWVLVTSVNLTSITYVSLFQCVFCPFWLHLGTLIRCMLELLYVHFITFSVFLSLCTALWISSSNIYASSLTAFIYFQSALACSLKF